MKQLWTESWRPDSLDGYVFKDQQQKATVEQWIRDGTIPHLLFSGSPGTGKTTLARILIKQLGVNPYDVLEINASRENNVDVIRNRITGFAETMPFGQFKVVLLDEADFISPAGQAALRGVMEANAASARFILTCNYLHKVIPALQSRCQGFHIEQLDSTEFTARAAEILIGESVEFDIDLLDTYVKATYPDLRKCINLLQMNSINNQLVAPDTVGSTADWKISAVQLFKQHKIRQARELITKQVRADEVDELIRWSYDNLGLWATTPEQEDEAILVIRKAAVNASLVADHEINVAAMLVELSQIQ